MRVAVIGSGFAGVSTALQLLAHGAKVALLDGSELRGRGIAYGRARPHHLLNVPADRMGLDPGDAGAFADWLGLSGGARGGFRPRAEYGRYLLDRLQAARREHGPALQVVDEDAHSLQRDDTGWRLHTNAGTTLQADAVVIAVGAPASSPARGATPAGVVADPWQPGALDGIAPDAEVLIVGTGLTMADLVLTLDSRNHRGRIVAISRRGLLPRPHPADGVVPQPLPEAAMTALEQGRLASAVRGFRRAVAAGAAPEALVDGLRGHTARAWRGWPLAVRQRFLRHLRPWWDTVRHRIPAQVAAELERLRARGRLEIAAARLEALSVDAGGVRATLRRRRSASAEARRFAAVLMATGLDGDVREAPLLAGLLSQGLAAADPTGLGLACTPEGQALDTNGRPVPGLFLVGALRRGECWESTAVAELRAQAAAVAALAAGNPADA